MPFTFKLIDFPLPWLSLGSSFPLEIALCFELDQKWEGKSQPCLVLLWEGEDIWGWGELVGAGVFEANLKLERGLNCSERETDGELGQGTDAAAAPSPVDLRPPRRLCGRKHTKARFLLASRFPTGETLLQPESGHATSKVLPKGCMECGR